MLKLFCFTILLFTFSGILAAKPFIDNGNGTVTDKATRLVWQQATASPRNWEQALSYCEGLILASQNDWRLPNIKELESITDDEQYNPAIDTNVFPGTQSYDYWSSTTNMGNMSYAWRVDSAGGIDFAEKSISNSYYARCVRGGM